MKVITFARYFPKKHQREGEATFFVERIWKGLDTGNRMNGEYSIYYKLPRLMKDGHWQLPHLWRDQMIDKKFFPKYHTIRAGKRWKVGDWFSPRIWSGLPYRSKQIQFAPDIQIKNIWDVNIGGERFNKCVSVVHDNSKYETLIPLADVAKNDGLSNDDFINWFPNNFSGQILCWSNKIKY